MMERVFTVVQLEWKNPDVEGLVEFLVKQKGFKYVSQFSTLFQQLTEYIARNMYKRVLRNFKSSCIRSNKAGLMDSLLSKPKSLWHRRPRARLKIRRVRRAQRAGRA
jgi:hypothetical protein